VGLTAIAATPSEKADKQDKKKTAPKPVEAGRVYTQADLERVIQESKDAPPTPLPPAQPPVKPTDAQLPASEAKVPAAPKKDTPLSFDTDDLERMYGKAEESAAPEAGGTKEGEPPKLPDPVDEVADWQAQRTAAELQRTRAQARVTELEAQVRDLEQREAAVRNPLLPRPAAPTGLEAEWETMSGTQRVSAIQGRLADLRAQLGKARQDVIRADADLRKAEDARDGAAKPN
jgi:hypothetical protein